MSMHEVCENWILDGADLQSEDSEKLKQHLSDCNSCRTLQQNIARTEALFHETPVRVPAAGFTSRFLEMKRKREAEEKQLRFLRTAAAVFAGIGLVALTFCLLLMIPENLTAFLRFCSGTLGQIKVLARELSAVFAVLEKPLTILAGSAAIAFLIYFIGLFISACFLHVKRVRNEGMAVYAENN